MSDSPGKIATLAGRRLQLSFSGQSVAAVSGRQLEMLHRGADERTRCGVVA